MKSDYRKPKYEIQYLDTGKWCTAGGAHTFDQACERLATLSNPGIFQGLRITLANPAHWHATYNEASEKMKRLPEYCNLYQPAYA